MTDSLLRLFAEHAACEFEEDRSALLLSVFYDEGENFVSVFGMGSAHSSYEPDLPVAVGVVHYETFPLPKIDPRYIDEAVRVITVDHTVHKISRFHFIRSRLVERVESDGHTDTPVRLVVLKSCHGRPVVLDRADAVDLYRVQYVIARHKQTHKGRARQSGIGCVHTPNVMTDLRQRRRNRQRPHELPAPAC
jgi:hypothetical protein